MSTMCAPSSGNSLKVTQYPCPFGQQIEYSERSVKVFGTGSITNEKYRIKGTRIAVVLAFGRAIVAHSEMTYG
jgi:hypothetical protein